MSNEVLYRRWRPQRFAEVAGQEPVTRTLANAVAQGRLAHAYLFCGPRGTGKTSTGRILAKAVNCTDPQGGEPCNACDSCRAYLEGRALDLVEMDAASNRGIDDIRSLREKVGYAPGSSRYKVYLIDEVHELTAQAFDALLKTLEEPPPHVLFILATTEAHKVPATIISRCQRFDFRRIPLSAIVERLAVIARAEGFQVDEESLGLVARKATGALRDAINLLEQMVAFFGPRLTAEEVRQGLGLTGDPRSRELVGCVLGRDLAGALRLLSSVRDDGLDLRQFQREVVEHLRSLLLVKAGAAAALDLPQGEAAALEALAKDASPSEVARALRAFGGADLRSDPHSPLPLELAAAECVLGPAEAAVAPAPQPEKVVPMRPPAERERPAAPGPAARREAPPPGRAPAPPEPRPVGAAPAGEPTALEGAAPPDGDGELADRIRLQLRQDGKQDRQRQTVSALLNGSCTVLEVTDQELTLGFFRRFKFHWERVESAPNRKLVEEAASKVLGRAVRLKCVLLEEDARPRRSGGHLVRAARELGARVIIDGG